MVSRVPRAVRVAVASAVTAAFVAACYAAALWLVGVAGPGLGTLLVAALMVLVLMGATGRAAWVWSLLSIDDPIAWAGFLPPLWRWALRDDRPASVSWR